MTDSQLFKSDQLLPFRSIERLQNENEDKTKTQMTQSFNQYSENETKFGAKISQINSIVCLRLVFVLIS